MRWLMFGAVLVLFVFHLWTISELDLLQKQVMQLRGEIQVARP